MKIRYLRKLSFCAVPMALCLFMHVGAPVQQAQAEETEYKSREVYVGGMAAGFLLSTEGVKVVGFCEVVTQTGSENPAKDSPIRIGDNILKANGALIRSTEDLSAALKKSDGKQMKLTVERNGEQMEICVTPVKDMHGKYKLGILIRDSISGIGTVTYIEKDDHRFASLGHAVVDEKESSLSIADKNVYLCSVVGVNKGVRGKAGELKGLFLNDKPIAKADTVLDTGIYGEFSPTFDFETLKTVSTAEVSDAHIGKATIYSCLSGTTPASYEISIVKVDKKNRENKNYVIKMSDEDLLNRTGGIVQGMSGSPILQDGKLIGAVTHVFLNDPTRGYGIAIENMLGH